MCRFNFLHYLYEKKKNNAYWLKCGFDEKNHGVSIMCGFDLYFYMKEKKLLGFNVWIWFLTLWKEQKNDGYWTKCGFDKKS